jgi:hypothetical protein
LCSDGGGFASPGKKISDDTEKIFLDSDIEMQEALSWGFLLPQAYGLIRKTFPLPLGTYARVGGCAD